MLPGQAIVGGIVSTTVTDWLHVLVLPHASVACHVRVIIRGQTPLVTVLRMETVRFVPLQLSLTVGASKVQAVPHWTVLLVAQLRTKAGGQSAV